MVFSIDFFIRYGVSQPEFLWTSVYTLAICFFWFLGYLSIKSRSGWKTSQVDWNEEVVVITGGSKGLGSLLAETLAIRNVTVVILDIRPPEIENVNVMYYECDVSKLEEVQRVAKEIIDEVTIASALGFIGIPQLADYCASKSALIGFHDTLRRELDGRNYIPTRYNAKNIRTTLVCPGEIKTGMFDGVTVRFPFLTPSMAALEVVKPIITALDKNEEHYILIPFYVNILALLRFLPLFLNDGERSMLAWKGKYKNKDQ
ncbi:20848_t:CDS:2 [Cetraspora pellucida]|uniref:20848_t:CDS:1 n=1 Tax=Cetraspora pellucida TaxID=1433469 RepID=A0A9N9BK23_9GLOM|nr:20848_t:CDS:2 [Cetraspora pellucida]